MSFLLISLTVLLAGAAATALLAGRAAMARKVFVFTLTVGCGLGLAGALLASATDAIPTFRVGWPIPLGELAIAIDPLSAFFLLLIFGVCLLAGWFGEGYLARSPHLSAKPSIRPLYLAMTAAMATVVCARNAVLFIGAWEIMALCSFLLIMAEHEDPVVRRAGLLYFACTHVATLALFALFAVLGRATGSLDFDTIRSGATPELRASVLVLILGVLAFGIKAGFAPLHVWLQEAHPAAPSHVSAVFSGVLIKVGIYGFLRLIWLLGAVPESWAICLIAIGAVSGVGGVLFALAQHDLKRLLAYHSVENIGIIALGMGLGCLGLAHQRPELAVIGFTGAILHTLNHGLFKSLLFLGSGAFYQALGTRNIEAGGGLLRSMPWTSTLSLIGAAAICGIPPLNGFVSEWVIYRASLLPGSVIEGRAAAVVVISLALIGGLAIACFTKAYGALCLGRPRTPRAVQAADPGRVMTAPMAALAAACFLIGIWPGPVTRLAGRAAAGIGGYPATSVEPALASILDGVQVLGGLAVLLLAVTGVAMVLRSFLLRGRTASGPTWGCGWTAPSPRMQYTASSYAQPLVRLFGPVLATRARVESSEGFWPAHGSFSSHTDDRILDGLLLPAASLLESALGWMKHSLRSRLQYYMLYVFIFTIIILFWKL